MQKLIILALMLLIALPVSAETSVKVENKKPQVSKQRGKVKSPAPLRLKTEEDKTLYAVGLVLARQLSVFKLSPRELRIVKLGLNDGVKGLKPKVDFAVYSKKSAAMSLARRDAHGIMLAEKTPEYMHLAEAEEGAVKTATGIIYRSLREGEGASPIETDNVKLHQRGTLIDGVEISSSYKLGEPTSAELKEFLPCMIEGVKMMKPGGRARLVCPPETAYAKEGTGVIPPNAVLLFEIELLEVIKPEPK